MTTKKAVNPPLSSLQQAMVLIKDDLDAYNVALEKALAPQRPYLTDTELEIYRQGKKVRPLLVLLSARMVYPDNSRPLPVKIINAAVSTEMLHVATLIHDDIIDRAPIRRGLPSVNTRRGTDMAILMGDLQFVQSIRCFTENFDCTQEMYMIRLVLNTAFRICCGEIDELQTDPSMDPMLLRKRYYSIIERKTAVLFGLACEGGVLLGGGRTRDARRAGFYGRRLGRAFQIMDDVFDIERPPGETGKLQGTDLACRRCSLPIIYAMQELGSEHLVSRIIKGESFTQQELHQGIKAIKHSNGFIRTRQEARHQIIDGIGYLEGFPENEYRETLKSIAWYVVNRSNK